MEAVNAYLSGCDDGSLLGIKAVKGILRHLPSLVLPEGDTRLPAQLVRALNEPDDNLRVKEVCLEALCVLAQQRGNLDAVQLALAGLTTGFERFFETTSDLESATVSRSLHVHMLTLFYRMSGYSLSGADLVELTSTLPSALYALQSVFFDRSLPHEIHIAAADTLMQLTLPDTYFANEACTDLTDLERLTRKYNKQVNTLMATCMELELFNVVSELLKPWLRHCTTLATEAKGGAVASLLSPLHSVMHGVLQFTVNLLNYSTSHGKKFRHHLAVDSDIIADVVLPYLLLSAETVAASAKVGSLINGRDVDAIRLALKVLVVATFKIKTLRRYLREHNFALKMLAVDPVVGDERVLALLIKLNINIDFSIPPSNTPRRMSRSERVRRSVESKDDVPSGSRELPSESNLERGAAQVVAAFRARVRSLTDEGRARLRKRLAAVDPSSPLNRACKSYDVLSFAVDTLQYDIDAASGAGTAASIDALGLGAAVVEVAGGDDDDDDDEPVVVMETPRLGRSALSMLSKWQSQRDAPAPATATGAGAGAGAGVGAAATKEEASAGAGEGESKDASADTTAAVTTSRGGARDDGAAAPKAKRAGATASDSGRFKVRAPHFVPPMAGRLPSMGSASAPSDSSKPGALPTTSAAVAAVPVPARHLCALSKSVMEDPVTTPDGVNFERSAIEDYLATRDLCPVTGNPLSIDALKTNKELSKEIALFQFRRLMLGSRLSRR